ncbi:MAG: transposase, partial [Clostridia bacterium]|nr:transposase [Clostridia bacterium]
DHPDGVSTLEILRINHMRWQIEDCFRDMKTEFKSRPVYLSKENRIKAHFLLCFLSLILLKYLEKVLIDSGFKDFSTEQLLACLRSLNMFTLRVSVISQLFLFPRFSIIYNPYFLFLSMLKSSPNAL